MAIENFAEVQQYISENMDKDENIKNYVGSFINPDRVNSFLNTEDGKKLLQPKLDSYATKAITSHDEKFKTNELPKLIDAKIKELYPDQDPKDKALADLKAEIAQMKAEGLRKELVIKASKIMQEKKLPLELLDILIGADEIITINNLTTLEKTFAPHVEALVNERMKSGYIPPVDKTPPTGKNPWSKEHFNLTEQGKIMTEDPTLATQLITQAKS